MCDTARVHRRVTLGIVGASAIGLAVAGWFVWRESRALTSPPELLARLPTRDAVVFGIEFATLRRGGLLTPGDSKSPEEAEYQSFVRGTNFDYKRDLDSVFGSFGPDGTFFLVRGRFDWKKLEEYARQQGGSCYNQLCRMQGSQADRRISFLPLKRDLMALAVGQDDLAAARLQKPGPQRLLDAPGEPVWLSIPPDALKRQDLPASTRMFASVMADTQSVLLTFGPQGRKIEARLEAVCKSPADAASLARQLERATAMLRQAIVQQKKKPDANDLTGVLTAGVFQQTDNRVLGRWPLDRSFLENLLGQRTP